MKELIDGENQEVIQALSGRGEYRLSEQARHLGVALEEWTKMQPDQRKKAVQRFMSFRIPAVKVTPARKEALSSTACTTTDSCSCPSKVISLPVSVQECVPLITLEAIWSKATALLQGDNTLSPAPGAD